MKKMILLAVLSLFLISSCKKGRTDFVLTGTITDASYNVGLTGATVKLYGTEAGTTNTDLVTSTSLDSDGNYSLTFSRDKIETYYIEVEKNNYFDIYEAIPFSSLSVEEDNIRDFSTTAKSWVKFHVVNSGGSPSDVMEYVREQGKLNCAECCPGGYQYFYGAVDTTFYCINDGNTVYSGHYWVQGGGPSGPIYVTTPPFDTVDVQISY